MGLRRVAREAALQYLYSVEFAGDSPERRAQFWAHTHCSEAAREYGQDLVQGVVTQRAKVDGIISEYLTTWRLARLTAVDRNILRIAVFELMFHNSIPEKVVINEAIEIAKKYGSEKTAPFVNGLLDRFLRQGGLQHNHE